MNPNARAATPVLDTDAVRHLEQLAVLAVEPAERAVIADRLQAMLEAVDALFAVDVEGYAPMWHPPLPEGVALPALRPDEPGPTLPVAAVEALAHDLRDGFLAVPKVLGP